MHRVAAQPDHGEQELLARGKGDGGATANGALAVWAAEARMVLGDEGGQQVLTRASNSLTVSPVMGLKTRGCCRRWAVDRRIPDLVKVVGRNGTDMMAVA
jgi:hypothetical protein